MFLTLSKRSYFILQGCNFRNTFPPDSFCTELGIKQQLLSSHLNCFSFNTRSCKIINLTFSTSCWNVPSSLLKVHKKLKNRILLAHIHVFLEERRGEGAVSDDLLLSLGLYLQVTLFLSPLIPEFKNTKGKREMKQLLCFSPAHTRSGWWTTVRERTNQQSSGACEFFSAPPESFNADLWSWLFGEERSSLWGRAGSSRRGLMKHGGRLAGPSPFLSRASRFHPPRCSSSSQTFPLSQPIKTILFFNHPTSLSWCDTGGKKLSAKYFLPWFIPLLPIR